MTPAFRNNDVTDALDILSASTCKDRGTVSPAFRNDMEDNSVWPAERYSRTVEPFCGSRVFELNGSSNKLTVFDAKQLGHIDLNLNPHVCFAYYGNIGSKIKVNFNLFGY